MMKRLTKLFLFLFMIFPHIVLSQGVDFSGYCVNFLTYQSLKSEFADMFGIDKNLFLRILRLRFRGGLDVGWDSKFYAECEMSGIYHSANLFVNLAELFLRRQILKLRWNLKSGERFGLFHFIDRLYFTKNFEVGNLTIGRRRISWGTGRIWNPTDLFSPINPANFTKLRKTV